jgi:hypothetical protein
MMQQRQQQDAAARTQTALWEAEQQQRQADALGRMGGAYFAGATKRYALQEQQRMELENQQNYWDLRNFGLTSKQIDAKPGLRKDLSDKMMAAAKARGAGGGGPDYDAKKDHVAYQALKEMEVWAQQKGMVPDPLWEKQQQEMLSTEIQKIQDNKNMTEEKRTEEIARVRKEFDLKIPRYVKKPKDPKQSAQEAADAMFTWQGGIKYVRDAKGNLKPSFEVSDMLNAIDKQVAILREGAALGASPMDYDEAWTKAAKKVVPFYKGFLEPGNPMWAPYLGQGPAPQPAPGAGTGAGQQPGQAGANQFMGGPIPRPVPTSQRAKDALQTIQSASELAQKGMATGNPQFTAANWPEEYKKKVEEAIAVRNKEYDRMRSIKYDKRLEHIRKEDWNPKASKILDEVDWKAMIISYRGKIEPRGTIVNVAGRYYVDPGDGSDLIPLEKPIDVSGAQRAAG